MLAKYTCFAVVSAQSPLGWG